MRPVHADSRTASAAPSPCLRTEAWLLRGLFASIPGELILANGAIGFIARDTGSAWPSQLRALERQLDKPGLAAAIGLGQPSRCFHWRVDAVDARVPRHYFGGGIRLRHAGIVLSFGFARPANLEARRDGLGEVRRQLAAVRHMRAQCRRWMDALAAAPVRRDRARR